MGALQDILVIGICSARRAVGNSVLQIVSTGPLPNELRITVAVSVCGPSVRLDLMENSSWLAYFK